MSIRIGYLLPTRERIMAEQPQAAPLLELAERAERLGFVLSGPVYQRNRRPQGGTGRLQGDAGQAPYHGWPPTKPSHLSCRGCRREELN
jgi:hypothetical protein